LARPSKFDVTAAVRGSDLPAPARLLMLVLADVANPTTAETLPSYTPSLVQLVKETGLGAATVKRYLTALEVAGWLTRKRPSAEASRRGERTRYRLKIPSGTAPRGRPTAGLGVGPQRAQGRPTAGPPQNPHVGNEVGPQRAQGRPTAGPKESTNKDLTKNLKPKSRLASLAPTPETAQTVLAQWIDYCRSKGVQLPKRLIAQYARLIKEALDEGFTPNHVKTALAGMLRDSIANRPTLLPNRLVSIQTGPETHSRPSTTDRRVIDALALADQFPDTPENHP
jgi:hypothetical protein